MRHCKQSDTSHNRQQYHMVCETNTSRTHPTYVPSKHSAYPIDHILDLTHLQLRVCWQSEVPACHSSSAWAQSLPSICSPLQQAAETLPVQHKTQGKGYTAWEWRLSCPKQQQCSVCIFNSFLKCGDVIFNSNTHLAIIKPC